ncbi:MAG: histidyl-tRNA synthase [Marmoricola sp.]|nr:histidyl-tRNA synthase [Marmoricola sp.]
MAAKPTPLSGYPELLPAQRFAETQIIATLSRTFELHGFANIETRAVEPLDQLLSKGETSKEVYVLRRLQEDEGGKDAGLGLHFDLTVPFARYVLENSGKLDFPFRRYQIQKVWRGERPQQGRYREFTQADIDVVGAGELPFHHDIEVARVMAEALAALPIPRATLQINNRKVLEGFYLGLGLSDTEAVMRVVDKLDKVPADKLGDLLVSEGGTTAEQARAVLALAGIRSTDSSFVSQVNGLGVSHPLLVEGLDELAQVVEGCQGIDGVDVVADLRIARGLDYYTGTVFETRLAGYDQLGSICSGGRYDRLASDGTTTYPGVGISFGLSRVVISLVAGGLTANRTVPSAVLVALSDEESRSASDALATQLRANGVPCEVSASAQRFGKQIRYAERRGIPYVLFSTADGPQMKDIRSGDQVPVDPATWTPPAEDLRPSIAPTQEKNP